ncbi:MAG: SLC13 family permease [Chloroflexota bacterium]
MNSFAAWFSLLLTLASTAALIGDWLRPDLVGLLVMVALGVTGVTTPDETFAGFSGSAVITLLAISILAEGLTQSGVTQAFGQRLKRIAGQGEGRLVLVITLAGAFCSLFMNNIAALGVLFPVAMSLARTTRVPPSRLLMPLASGVVVGGMATLFTASNIISSGVLRDAGFRPFGLLEFLPVGIPLILIVALYMTLVGRRLLPDRFPADLALQLRQVRQELIRMYGVEATLGDYEVQPESPLAGRSIRDGRWANEVGLYIVGIFRDGILMVAPSPNEIIRPHDVVLARGDSSALRLRDFGLLPVEIDASLLEADPANTLAEVVLPPHSSLAGRSLRALDFREKFALNVLAIWRNGKPLYHQLADLPLEVGDGLLVQGSVERLRLLYKERDLMVLEEDPEAVLRPRKMWLAGLVGLATLAVAILGWLPISVASLAGAVAMLLAGCLTLDEAYKSIEWRTIFLIVGFWPLSTAITKSGLAAALVADFLHVTAGAGPILLVALLLLVTALLTNVMAGQSAAPIILAPVGLSVAQAAGLDPRTALMAIALGCSLAFPTPIGHPVNVMVMGPGGYTFRDYLKVGLPLTAILFPAILLGLRIFWNL